MRRNRTARRGLAAVAVALTLGLSLAACGGDSGDKPSPSASASTGDESAAAAADKAALAKVDVSWSDDKAPVVTLPSKPFSVTTPVIEVREPGKGAELKAGQSITIDFVAVSGADGKVAHDTTSTGPEPGTLGKGSVLDGLIGEKVGVRFVLAGPPQQGGTESTVIAGQIVDAKDAPTPAPGVTKAAGEAVPPVAGLPTVTLDANGKPSVTPVSTPAPTTLVAQPLIKGTGPVVTADQTLVVQYSLFLWDGTPVESSWESGQPATFALNAVIPGWTEGLAGQTVGSQVLLVVPPDKGYGASGQGDSIPPNSTLIFVVDILAAS
ncbi:FKBP-type peptidyl-prolyl cis-trans isomerase [Cellulomonas sp. URHD0024]|uniref:FKBP-type peptidyl-prolyl cis-trans isomerase n=1 Tax=Cellulomonas sp. URHD0024 TaxID=1302620 RepID=UPI0003FB845B|nr:FKBP-type peptidyl-prolyl cis-trans isomerase [Cellulomonas sp. URHD0024]